MAEPARERLAEIRERADAARPYMKDGTLIADLDVLLALVEELTSENASAMESLREFNHVEGEPLAEVAAVAASAYAFLNHRVAALARELADTREALEAADDLLRRLSEWDMLYVPTADRPPATADAPYWQGEIGRMRERLAALSAGRTPEEPAT